MYDYKVESVVRVVDGDTVIVGIDVGFYLTTVQHVRLLGVDTPERGQTGYRECTEFTRAWLQKHPDTMIHTIKTDAFGRWLGRITEISTGIDLSDEILAFQREFGFLKT